MVALRVDDVDDEDDGEVVDDHEEEERGALWMIPPSPPRPCLGGPGRAGLFTCGFAVRPRCLDEAPERLFLPAEAARSASDLSLAAGGAPPPRLPLPFRRGDGDK